MTDLFMRDGYRHNHGRINLIVSSPTDTNKTDKVNQQSISDEDDDDMRSRNEPAMMMRD